MRIKAIKYITLLIITVSSLSVYADQTITLEEVLKLGIEHSPDTGEIYSRISRQKAEGINIQTLNNPVLDFEILLPYDNKQPGDNREIAVSVSQPLRVSDFGHRAKINNLIQETSSLDEKIELLNFSQKIKIYYYKTKATEDRLANLENRLNELNSLRASVNLAFKNGLISASDEALFRSETIKLRILADSLKADATKARNELSSIAGVRIEKKLMPEKLSPVKSAQQIIKDRQMLPMQARAKLAAKLAAERSELARLDSYSAITPRLGYHKDSDEVEYIALGIAVELPFFDRNQSERLASLGTEQYQQKLNQYYSSENYINEIEALSDSINRNLNSLSTMENELIKLLSTANSTEQKLFRAGQGSALKIWQVNREQTALDTEIFERKIQLSNQIATLSSLTGIDF